MSTSKTRRNQKKGMEQNRILISVNVIGSAGPIRFIVNEDDTVADVVGMTLRIYSQQGRLPIHGFDVNHFNLLCPTTDTDTDVLHPLSRICSSGARNYLLCKKPQLDTDDDENDILVAKNAGKGTTKALKSCLGF